MSEFLSSESSEIEVTRQFGLWLDKMINGLDSGADHRARISSALFDLVHEYNKAIIVVLERHLPGAAHALVRPSYEAWVRAIWIKYCATDNEISNFLNDDVPHLDSLIKAIKKSAYHAADILSETHKTSYSAMCGYTHGGIHQVSRRNQEKHIAPNYPLQEQCSVLYFSSMCTAYTAGEIFYINQRKDLMDELNTRLKNVRDILGIPSQIKG